MTSRFARSTLGGLTAALVLVAPACDYLRDTEPFTITITYETGPDGRLKVTPIEFTADAAFGDVQVVNDTEEKHGFAVRDLGVFEDVLAKQNRTIRVDDARDGKTYVFECHIHDGEYQGTMLVHYVAEEER